MGFGSDGQQMCLRLIDNHPMWDTTSTYWSFTWETGSAAMSYALPEFMRGRAQRGSVRCQVGHPNSGNVMQWGYINMDTGTTQQLEQWLKTQPGVTGRASDGRMIYSIPGMSDGGVETRWYSVSSHDVVFATNDGVWNNILDL